MAYGTIKVDTITFTDSGVDKSVSISGLVQNPTFSGNITVTGTVSGNTIQGQTVSGVTVTGTTANFTSGNFTTFTGGTITLTSGVIASGTDANPSLSILGDANTGLYSPGADQLAISTGGSGRLFVDASGNVGVGTNDTANAFVTLTNQDVSLRLNPVTGSASITAVQTGVAFRDLTIGSNQTIFQTAATERLRITSAGLVGVGTSSPSYALEVAESVRGNIAIRGNFNGGTDCGHLRYFNINGQVAGVVAETDAASSPTSKLYFQTTATGTLATRMTLSSTGLGVGTTSPDAKLLVSDGTNINTRIGQLSLDNFTGEGAGIRFSRTTSDDSLCALGTLNAGDGDLGLFSRNSLIFATGGASNYSATTERARIDSSGRLGIGTSDPTSGTSSYYDDLVVRNATSGTGAGITIQSNSTNGFSGLNLRKADGTDLGKLVTDSSDGKLYIETAGVSAITVDTSQRVGVGTTTVTYNLEVAGTSPIIASSGSSTPRVIAIDSKKQFAGLRMSGDVAHLEATFFSGAGGGYTPLTFWTSDTERGRFDTSGRLLVGTSSARSNFYNSTNSPQLQIEGNDNSKAALAIIQDFNANSQGGQLVLAKNNSTTVGSNVLVVSGDTLGSVSFQGNDGTEFVEGASITAAVDGTSGANDLPTRLVFSTCADGASSPTERMRITSDAYVRLASGTGGIQFNGDTAAANALDDYEEGTWTPVVTGWTSVTYTVQDGKYIKIGKHLTAWFYIQFSGTSAATTVAITGLPFTEETFSRGGSLTYYYAPLDETSGVLIYPAGGTISLYNDNDTGSLVQSNGNASGSYLIGSINSVRS